MLRSTRTAPETLGGSTYDRFVGNVLKRIREKTFKMKLFQETLVQVEKQVLKDPLDQRDKRDKRGRG